MMFQLSKFQAKPICRVVAGLLMSLMILPTPWFVAPSVAQKRKRERATNQPDHANFFATTVVRATGNICELRTRDRQGTLAIDQMAMMRPLELTDPLVVAGKQRAERLLPLAKQILPGLIARLEDSYGTRPTNRTLVTSRLSAIDAIRPDITQHDNATVRASEPRVVIFGTVFLAGLRSDEAMLAVLAHELTHVVDGSDHSLQSLFQAVGDNASALSGLSVYGRPAIEVTCELIGLRALQEHVGGGSGDTKRLRLARALQKDCVTQDLADETHLSPRETLRVLLFLAADLAATLSVTRDNDSKQRSVADFR
jgi:Zn-dependent protease with chaperone function